MTTETLIMFMLLYALSIVFSAISLERESMISFLLAGIMWFTASLSTFLVGVSLLQTVLGYIMLTLGFIFTLAALKVLVDAAMEQKKARWKPGL